MSSQTPHASGFAGAIRRRSAGSFEGVSLAAYRRLLGSALGAAEAAGFRRATTAAKLCEAGVPPHLAKVYEIWPGQQRKSMEDLGRLLSAARKEVSRLHAIFTRVRGRMGDETLEAVLRVLPGGDIRPCREMDDEFTAEEKRACRMIYSLYTLGIGATPEVRTLLSKVLTQKLSPGRKRVVRKSLTRAKGRGTAGGKGSPRKAARAVA
jgi:hypothetical protein